MTLIHPKGSLLPDSPNSAPDATTDSEQQAGLPGVRLVVGRLLPIAFGGLLGLALGLLATVLSPPHYTSTAYLSVSSSTAQDSESMARTAQALARIATAPSVVAGPLRAAGLGAAARNPRTSILSQAAPDAPVFSVSGESSDPVTAQRIASVTTRALTAVRSLGPFQAVVVAPAPLPTSPVTPRWVPPAGGLLAGLGLATVLAATVPHRRRRLRGARS